MDGQELMKKVKEEFDQHCTEKDMSTLQLLWIIEGIDGDHPLHDAMECAYAVQDQFYAVKAGYMPNW